MPDTQRDDTQMRLGGPSLPNVGTRERRVLEMLLSRRWVCGQEFSLEVGWSFGARLSELRSRGYEISKRPCRHPRHHHNVQLWQYGLVDA